MAFKTYTIDGIGEVRVQKRRGTRNMRIRITGNGQVAVSLPYWLPFQAGAQFAISHRLWIEKHRTEKRALKDGDTVGLRHRLEFISSKNLKTSVRNKAGVITVSIPAGLSASDTQVQLAAIRGAKKALTEESDTLAGRIKELAGSLGYAFKDLRFKFLKSKWGSCSSDKVITLSYRLQDLPDELIDYVMVHELAHTKHLNHSSQFWAEVEKTLPNYKMLRKQLKNFRLPW